MAQTLTLEQRLEQWPEQWRQARTQYGAAKALVARLEAEQARIEQEARMTDQGDRQANEDIDDGDVGESPALLRAAEIKIDDLTYHFQTAQVDLKAVQANADMRIRRQAQQDGVRLTESAVMAQVQADQECVDYQKRLADLAHQLAQAKRERDDLRRQAQRERIELLRNARSSFNRDFADRPMRSAPSPLDDAARKMQEALDQAYVKLDEAATALGYQRRVGQALLALARLTAHDNK